MVLIAITASGRPVNCVSADGIEISPTLVVFVASCHSSQALSFSQLH